MSYRIRLLHRTLCVCWFKHIVLVDGNDINVWGSMKEFVLFLGLLMVS